MWEVRVNSPERVMLRLAVHHAVSIWLLDHEQQGIMLSACGVQPAFDRNPTEQR